MKKEINAELLAQMALDQIEEIEVTQLLNDMIQSMPLPGRDDTSAPDDHTGDYCRLYAANRLSRASHAVCEKLKKVIISLLQTQSPKQAVTLTFGSRMFKFYYNRTFTWENLHPKERENETIDERELRLKVEEQLKVYNEACENIAKVDQMLRKYRRDKSAAEETLADLLPDSKCIKYSPVLQIV